MAPEPEVDGCAHERHRLALRRAAARAGTAGETDDSGEEQDEQEQDGEDPQRPAPRGPGGKEPRGVEVAEPPRGLRGEEAPDGPGRFCVEGEGGVRRVAPAVLVVQSSGEAARRDPQAEEHGEPGQGRDQEEDPPREDERGEDATLQPVERPERAEPAARGGAEDEQQEHDEAEALGGRAGPTPHQGAPQPLELPAHVLHGGQPTRAAGRERPPDALPPGGRTATVGAVQYVERQIIAWLAILLGVFFLSRALTGKREKGAMKELLGLEIDKVKHFRNFFMQRLESIVGFSFVLIGVGIHLYVLIRQSQHASASNDSQAALADAGYYLAFAVVAMVAITVAMHAICSYFSRRIFLDIVGYLMVRYNYRLEDDPALLKQIGDILRLEHQPDDTVQTYTRKIEESLRLQEIEARLAARGKLPARRARTPS